SLGGGAGRDLSRAAGVFCRRARAGRRMMAVGSRARSAAAGLTIGAGLLSSIAVLASPACPDGQDAPQTPKDPALCRELDPVVRKPSALPLDAYEQKLGEYLAAMCHRDEQGGWRVDKWVRDTGRWIGDFRDGKWSGKYTGTHAPALVWYSPDFFAWLK